MKKKKIEDLMKQAVEMAKSIGFDSKLLSTEKDLSLKIMQKIQKALDVNDLYMTITPIMYNPEDFMPVLGVLVKTENGLCNKYTISITEVSK